MHLLLSTRHEKYRAVLFVSVTVTTIIIINNFLGVIYNFLVIFGDVLSTVRTAPSGVRVYYEHYETLQKNLLYQ